MTIGKDISWRHVKYHWEIYLFLVPAMFLILLFLYYPAFSGLYHSFFRWNGNDISEYVGPRNFLQLLADSGFWRSFEVALTIGVFNVIEMVPAILVAICIHRCKSEAAAYCYRVCFVFLMVIPSIVTVLIWRSFFFESTNGYLNKVLHGSGAFELLKWLDATCHWGGVFVDGVNPVWLGNPKLLLAACVLWGFPWVGSFAVLSYLARLQGIPKDIYEAAEIDGAGWWTKFLHVELPLLMGNIKLILVLVIIGTLKDAGTILALVGIEGGPGGVVTVPALFMMRKAFLEQDFGFACAVGIVLTAIVMALQKASNLITSWETFGTTKQIVIRALALAAGVAILCTGRFRVVGLALVAASLPYARLGGGCTLVIGKVAALFKRPLPPAEARPKPGAAPRRRVADRLLTAARHLTIWMILATALIPLYLMAIVSLKDNGQFYEAPATLTTPCHWENWRAAWEAVTPTLANTFFISISSTLLTLLCAIAAAYFFARHRMPLSAFFWNAILVIMIMPSIANLIPLFRLLDDLCLLNTLTALIVVGAAGGQMFAIFVFRAFVEDVPKDLFEAAEIDGANHFQQMRMIVVPLAGPIIGTVGVMQFMHQWNDFVLPLIIIRDHARLPIMVQLLRMAGEYLVFWGPLMAGYALASLAVIILFIFTMKLFTKGLTEGALKG